MVSRLQVTGGEGGGGKKEKGEKNKTVLLFFMCGRSLTGAGKIEGADWLQSRVLEYNNKRWDFAGMARFVDEMGEDEQG